ncbi:MAG: SUMF1/EgtB/PvdO family nonheme iron enzyme [Bryobacteraceae bacterium]
MVRGGSWNNNQENVRASFRNRNEPGNRNNNIGFRCVRDVRRRHRSPSQRFAGQGRRASAILSSGPRP